MNDKNKKDISKFPNYENWTGHMNEQQKQQFLIWIQERSFQVSPGSLFIYVGLYKIFETCELIYNGNKVRESEVLESIVRIENYLRLLLIVMCMGFGWQFIKDVIHMLH